MIASRAPASSYRFTTPGTFDYRCIYHVGKAPDGTWTGMLGKIVVTP